LHGVAEPLTVVRVGDEVAPGLGHALEPADGLGRASMPPSKSNL
jgi:hypothetical protein